MGRERNRLESALSTQPKRSNFSAAKTPTFRAYLLAWYDAHARDLPWRERPGRLKHPDPYRVWVSEIMLQQTRVAAVIDHYHKFLLRFPTVKKLASARESSVLAAWSGLGYYRRARMMHAAARVVVREHGGKFPATSEEWRELPGIGRYTAAAIASIAFGEAVAVVDGNVERVLNRFSGRSLSLTSEEVWGVAQELLDPKRPGDFNQAMMELGATVCTPRSPECLMCPVEELCATRGELPGTAKPEKQKKREIHYALHCRSNGRGEEVFLVQRSRDASLMAGMWELPEISARAKARSQRSSEIAALKRCATQKKIPPPRLCSGPADQLSESARGNDKANGNSNDEADGHAEELLFTVRHSITVTDYTVRIWHEMTPDHNAGEWLPFHKLPKVALTGLARKILKKAAILR